MLAKKVFALALFSKFASRLSYYCKGILRITVKLSIKLQPGLSLPQNSAMDCAKKAFAQVPGFAYNASIVSNNIQTCLYKLYEECIKLLTGKFAILFKSSLWPIFEILADFWNTFSEMFLNLENLHAWDAGSIITGAWDAGSMLPASQAQPIVLPASQARKFSRNWQSLLKSYCCCSRRINRAEPKKCLIFYILLKLFHLIQFFLSFFLKMQLLLSFSQRVLNKWRLQRCNARQAFWKMSWNVHRLENRYSSSWVSGAEYELVSELQRSHIMQMRSSVQTLDFEKHWKCMWLLTAKQSWHFFTSAWILKLFHMYADSYIPE